MKHEKLTLLQKRGQAKVDSKISYLIGALIVVVLATSLAPEMFVAITDLENATGVPSWVPTVLFVIIGAGLVFLIWRAFGNK